MVSLYIFYSYLKACNTNQKKLRRGRRGGEGVHGTRDILIGKYEGAHEMHSIAE